MPVESAFTQVLHIRGRTYCPKTPKALRSGDTRHPLPPPVASSPEVFSPARETSMIDPLILRLARERFQRRCAEVGEEQALRELEVSFDQTLDALVSQAVEPKPKAKLLQ